MDKTDDLYKNTFEKTLLEHGFLTTNNTENIYHLTRNNIPNHLITAQFFVSEPIDELIHGSHNGNKIQAIGYFSFNLPPPGVNEPDFFIFGFYNPPKDCIEFVIVPYSELKIRLKLRNRNSPNNKEIEVMFWLMPDSGLYETKFIGSEGEWFYISSNGYGRMADDTYMNYTIYFNNWKGLMMV